MGNRRCSCQAIDRILSYFLRDANRIFYEKDLKNWYVFESNEMDVNALKVKFCAICF